MNKFLKFVLYGLRLYRFYKAPTVADAVSAVEKARTRLKRVKVEQTEASDRAYAERMEYLNKAGDAAVAMRKAEREAIRASNVEANIAALLDGGEA